MVYLFTFLACDARVYKIWSQTSTHIFNGTVKEIIHFITTSASVDQKRFDFPIDLRPNHHR